MSLGGSNNEIANSIKQTADGGYIVGGYSNSNDGNISGNHGSDDYWIVKLSTDLETFVPHLAQDNFSVSPNPVQSKLSITFNSTIWSKNVFVYDINGRLIDIPIALNENKIELTTSSLVDGVYAVHVIDFNTQINQVVQFIKQ